MSINYKPSQFELFPGSPGSSQDAQKPRYLFADLTLSLENIILVGIVLLMFLLFAFSMGVEKGKQLALDRSQQGVTIQARNMDPRLVREKRSTAVTASSKKAAVPLQSSMGKELSVPVKVEAVAPVVEQKEISVQAPLRSEQEILDKTFTVQVASFKSEKYANLEAETLKKKGYESIVLNKGEYSIVCVGKFAQMDEAKTFASKFKNKNKEYGDSLVRRM